MAFGLKEFALALVVLCGGVAMWIFPLSDETPPRDAWHAEQQRAEELGNELRRTEALLARRVMEREFREDLDQLPPSRDRVLISRLGSLEDYPPDDPVHAERERHRRIVERALEELPDRGPEGTRVAIFLFHFWHRLPGDERFSFGPRREYYLLEGPWDPVCVVAVFGPGSALPTERTRRGEITGPCAFFVRYGAPGREVGRWLEAGGYVLAQERGAPAGELGVGVPEREAFGIRREANIPLPGEGCLAGRGEACRAWLMDPDQGLSWYRGTRWFGAEPTRPPEDWVVSRSALLHWRPGAFLDEHPPEFGVMADVEREFGTKRFRRFWRSPAPVEEAFEEAFGRPMVEWIREWALARYGQVPWGPTPGVVTTLLSVLVLGVTFAAGAYIQARRSLD